MVLNSRKHFKQYFGPPHTPISSLISFLYIYWLHLLVLVDSNSITFRMFQNLLIECMVHYHDAVHRMDERTHSELLSQFDCYDILLVYRTRLNITKNFELHFIMNNICSEFPNYSNFRVDWFIFFEIVIVFSWSTMVLPQFADSGNRSPLPFMRKRIWMKILPQYEWWLL